MRPEIVVSCEHASNAVPMRYRRWFAGAEEALAGHRGWDPGAALVARRLAEAFQVRPLLGRTSRLLVDLNRSIDHPRFLSEWSRAMPEEERERATHWIYRRYRAGVAMAVQSGLSRYASVVHVSVHSFTPVLDGEVRNADVGFLYDPSRPFERELVTRWMAALAERAPELRVRRNYPYRGTADGHTTALRARMPADRYAGIEVELNQALFARHGAAAKLGRVLGASLRDALEG